MKNAILKDKILELLISVGSMDLKEVSKKSNIDIDVCFFLLTEMELIGHIKLEKISNDNYAIILKQLGRGFFKVSSYKKVKQKEDIDYRLKKVQYFLTKYWYVVMVLTAFVTVLIEKYVLHK